MWKKRKTDKKKEEKEENLLEELCGDDARLYDFLGRRLYLDPIASMRVQGISEKDLEILIEEAEKSIKDGNYKAIRKYREVMDKAIFEATQNPGERGRYIKVIQDLASKAVHATEKAKENAEKEGLTDHARASLGRRIENYEFMSERIKDIIDVASKFYNEKLVELGEKGRSEARKDEREEAQREEWRIEDRERAGREERKKERRDMGKEEKREAAKEEKKEELAAKERKQERKDEREEAQREEWRIEDRERAGREVRRKEREG